MSYAERTLDFLWTIAPDGATNADITRRLGTTSQTVYMLMQDLLRRGLVRGEQQGRTWVAFVSFDRQVVGNAKYYTRVRGTALPSTTFAMLSEHVWLLEKTGASTTFLVFGNDREIPVLWLERYGNLASGVAFYFLADDGQLEVLTPADAATDRTSGHRRA